MERVNVWKCECCGQETLKVIEGKVPELRKVKGKWDFLDELKPGDGFLTYTVKEYDNARRSMHTKRIKYHSAKQKDGSGWLIRVA